jgi:murein tripeptide amidase MpaA
MFIDAGFDSGNIVVVDASDPLDVTLRLRPDPPTDTPDGRVQFAQWFHFRVHGAAGVPLRLRILDADKAAYPDGWPGYRAAMSEDGVTWRRVDTAYVGGVLELRCTPGSDCAAFAYFAPYDLCRHAALVARCAAAPGVRSAPIGRSLDGRVIDRLVIGAPGDGRRTLWVLARQHPGETMAEWWMEGFLGRLLDPDDALAAALRAAAVLHVVPNINPDGSFRGHLRTNTAGANLNREWETPTPERSPEVLCCRDEMDRTGVDLCLDVHGDEGLPYNFIAGAEGIPGWTPRMAALQATFLAAYERANPHFQRVYGYGVDGPGEANLTMCTNHVAQRFDCLAMTLEMPFKDDANHPDPGAGWSPEKAKRLGASAIDALAAVVGGLR